jgi:hypothetical protein
MQAPRSSKASLSVLRAASGIRYLLARGMSASDSHEECREVAVPNPVDHWRAGSFLGWGRFSERRDGPASQNEGTERLLLTHVPPFPVPLSDARSFWNMGERGRRPKYEYGVRDVSVPAAGTYEAPYRRFVHAVFAENTILPHHPARALLHAVQVRREPRPASSVRGRLRFLSGRCAG